MTLEFPGAKLEISFSILEGTLFCRFFFLLLLLLLRRRWLGGENHLWEAASCRDNRTRVCIGDRSVSRGCDESAMDFFFLLSDDDS